MASTPWRLQWGRAFGARKPSPVARAPRAGWLQWGRAFGSAETICDPRRFCIFLVCFNGAALFGARKLMRGITPPPGFYASMGPRSSERGNCDHFNYTNRPWQWLQWGRALRKRGNTATANGRVAFAMLQWGRALLKRGNRGLKSLSNTSSRASMGPRSSEARKPTGCNP